MEERSLSSSRPAVVEVAIFRLRDGVTHDQLLGTVDAVSGWARSRPGFLSRELTYSRDDDSWIDVIWWESIEAAHAAAEAAATSESCAPMFALIDSDSVRMLHGERVVAPVASR